MKILEHPVEIFEDEDYKHHTAHWIMQVIDDSDKTRVDKLCGYTEIGYYFVDESEAYVIGPYDTFDLAVQARNDYFKKLLDGEV